MTDEKINKIDETKKINEINSTVPSEKRDSGVLSNLRSENFCTDSAEVDIVMFTKKLVEISSVSGNESELAVFISEMLSKDFKIQKQKVGNACNIIATRGNPRIIFNTHLDTVPGKIAITEDEFYLTGRGSCDAKGSMAAMILSAIESAKEGMTNFGLVFDVCEETDFSGVKEALNLVKPEIVVIGEPTNREIVIGQKGLLGIKIICKGKAAHGSTPEIGECANTKLIFALQKILALKLPEDERLGKTTLNIGLINGGNAINVIPNYAEATLEFRTTVSNEKVITLLACVKNIADIEIMYSYESVIMEDTHDVNLSKTVVPYFTTLYFWSKIAKAFVFGPGDPAYAHMENEKVEKKQIVEAKEVYKKLLQNYATKESMEK